MARQAEARSFGRAAKVRPIARGSQLLGVVRNPAQKGLVRCLLAKLLPHLFFECPNLALLPRLIFTSHPALYNTTSIFNIEFDWVSLTIRAPWESFKSRCSLALNGGHCSTLVCRHRDRPPNTASTAQIACLFPPPAVTTLAPTFLHNLELPLLTAVRLFFASL